jgi:hypothetical protein
VQGIVCSSSAGNCRSFVDTQTPVMGDAGRKNATSLIIGLIRSAGKIWTKRSKLLKGIPQQPHAISSPLAIPTDHPPLHPGDLAWDAARAQPSMPYEAVASVYRSPISTTGFHQPNHPMGEYTIREQTPPAQYRQVVSTCRALK